MPAFDRRLTFITAPGKRPWLAPDPGSEHVVVSELEISRAVESLGAGLDTIDRSEARAAADRHGVFGPLDPVQCGTRKAALAHVCRKIADIVRPTDLGSSWSWWQRLVRRREWLRLQRLAGPPGTKPFTYTAALFGEGAGILLQRTADEYPYWFQEDCFLLDEECAVHHFIAWSV
jgi:hypothetical protein